MKYAITFKKSAAKELEALPKRAVSEITESISDLVNEPRPSGSKKLKAGSENLWRIRVGDYRVIYLIEDTIRIVNIRRIAHRKEVYRR